MKKVRIITSCLLLFSFVALGNNNAKDTDSKKKDTDLIVSVKEIIYGDKIYFHVHVLNETENTIYSLIKYSEENPEEFKSVDIREGYANNINTPIFYSFKEEVKPDSNMTYKLIAIRKNSSNEIAEWCYNADDNSIHLINVKDKVVNELKLANKNIDNDHTAKIDDE